jgi:opacity protein-like surface antigen
MFRFLSTVSSLALIVGFSAAAAAQSSYSDTIAAPSYSTTTTEPSYSSSTTETTVAQALARPVMRESEGFAVRPGPYLRFDTGHSWATNRNVDDSWIVGAGAGWRFSPNLRGDITFDYRPDFNQNTSFGIGPGAKSGLHNWTLMANGYYDFTIGAIQPLVPYVGGGIGIAQNSVDGVTVGVPGTGLARLSGHDTNQFAWQLSAGVTYNFNPNLALDVGYRYLHAGETGLGGRLHANELSTSLRFGF